MFGRAFVATCKSYATDDDFCAGHDKLKSAFYRVSSWKNCAVDGRYGVRVDSTWVCDEHAQQPIDAAPGT
jgi:hypothetical protein